MCIMFFRSHHDGPREHYLGSYHCAHTDCPGTFESHHKYLLEESRLDCAECLVKDGVQVDPEVAPVQYYPPIAHFEIQYVEGKGWVKVGNQGDVDGTEKGTEGTDSQGKQENAVPEKARTTEQDEEEGREEDMRGDAHSFASLSDCDSVTSHWRLYQTFASPVRLLATATKEKSPSPPIQEPSPTEESYETRETYEPHEIHEVREPVYEDATNDQEPRQPVHPESPFGDSSNTLEHRHLVNQQLATLEHRMAHRQHQRHISQPTFDVTRPQRMTHHQRQNSKRRFDVMRPQRYAFPAPGTLGPPGPPGQPEPQHFMVAATPESGITPTWRWGPVPPPHLMIQLPPGEPAEAVHTRHPLRRAQGQKKKKIRESDAVTLVEFKE